MLHWSFLLTTDHFEINNTVYLYLDVDECKPTSSCHNDATCKNLPGNFTCSCNVGYSGDGFTCNGMWAVNWKHVWSNVESRRIPKVIIIGLIFYLWFYSVKTWYVKYDLTNFDKTYKQGWRQTGGGAVATLSEIPGATPGH